jgi:Tfp pilus assembly protein PilF
MSGRLRDWLGELLLLIVTLLAYQPAWNGKPVWDDAAHLTYQEHRSLHGLVRIWTEPGATQQYYPMVYTVFWVEQILWGYSMLGYHLLNIVLHVCAGLLLLKVLRTLQIPAAWLATAIFVLHPLQVESVAWLSELKNTLSGVCYFGAALAYLRFDRTKDKAAYALALVLFVFGLLAKTVIATLPAALLVVFWWQRGRLSWKHDVLFLIPFFAVGMAAGLFTSSMERQHVGAQGADFNFSLVERCLIAGRAIWFYLGKLVWPADLIFSYQRWKVNQTMGWQYLFPIGAALLIGALWVLRRRMRGPLAVLLFFLGTLFPALGFVNIYPFKFSFVADHFQYLACCGPIVAASVGIHSFCQRLGAWRLFWERSLWVALSACLGFLTWQQSHIYTDIETLWRATIARNPECWLALDGLGAVLYEKGQEDQAIDLFRRSLAIEPKNAEGQNNLGAALAKKGWLDEATLCFQKAVAIRPGFAEAYRNLGQSLLQRGNVDEAIVAFQQAVYFRPDYALAYDNLGNAFLQLGKVDDAIIQFQKLLALQPDSADARRTLAGIAWRMATASDPAQRNGPRAIELARETDQLDGGHNPMMAAILAASYAEGGQFDLAVTNALRALQLATAQKNTGMATAIQAQLRCYEAGSPFRDTGSSKANPIESK